MHREFNLDQYKQMLDTALDNGYRFEPFDILLGDDIDDATPVCLLRHDIDADMQAAYEMACLEQERGIKSTYFFMLRSPVYNLLSRANNDWARKIVDQGHFIGLHYDQGYSPGAHQQDETWMAYEASVIEDLLGVRISTVSFHQPSPDILDGKINTGRFLNTYTDPAGKGFHYISDSNRQWKQQSAKDIFSDKLHKKLQLLIHPMWWVHGKGLTTQDVWDMAIKANIGQMQKQLLLTERAYGVRRTVTFEAGGENE